MLVLGAQETIEHLFIACLFSKLLWCMMFFAFNLPSPANITNMFGNWLNGEAIEFSISVKLGVAVRPSGK
jgi:hypothetical protein